MASSPILSVQVTFENGPKVESKGKLEPGSYLFIEEDLCRCSTWQTFCLDAGSIDKIDMIVITAKDYAPDKETCTVNGSSAKKRIKFKFNGCTTSTSLDGPFILRKPFLKCNGCPGATLDYVEFQNEMPIDTKVSVLVVRGSQRTPDGQPCKKEKELVMAADCN